MDVLISEPETQRDRVVKLYTHNKWIVIVIKSHKNWNELNKIVINPFNWWTEWQVKILELQMLPKFLLIEDSPIYLDLC